MNLSLTVYYHNFFRAVFLSENIECRIKEIKSIFNNNKFHRRLITDKNFVSKLCFVMLFEIRYENCIFWPIYIDLQNYRHVLSHILPMREKNEIQRWKNLSYQLFYKMKMQFDLPKTLFKNVESWGLFWLLSNLVFGTIFYTE